MIFWEEFLNKVLFSFVVTLSKENIFDQALTMYGQGFKNIEYYTDRPKYNAWAAGIKAELFERLEFKSEYDCYFAILKYFREKNKI